ncbi:hypothetical protein Ddye_020637 [Dipteronia dyeriana]|uniref:Uncharacterized protein n=1 Tax=Dipteronia dyeriana TaxID=168575 RepID=A0AAD9U0B4_9ROSI|nr:hypothetical protein Ddye_020637 [Dipteronia dyeriana]
MLGLSTLSVCEEYQLGVSHLGWIRIQEDVFVVAIIIGRDIGIVDFSDDLIPRYVQGRK